MMPTHRIRIIRHEAVPKTGIYEVRSTDGHTHQRTGFVQAKAFARTGGDRATPEHE
jgi:hypothetical protein